MTGSTEESLRNNKILPLPIIRQITRFDNKTKQSQKQIPEIKTVIKVVSPIKPVGRKTTKIEKQVTVLETPEESNSDDCSDKYFDQYSLKGLHYFSKNMVTLKMDSASIINTWFWILLAVTNEMVDRTLNKRKSLNRKIKSSIMQMQKQYFIQDNGSYIF